MNLEETIQNYNNVGALMDESELQTLSWLEELQDLRAILRERAPGEEEAEKFTELSDDGPCTLEDYVNMLDYPVTIAEEQIQFWAKQLLRLRQRYEEDTV